jgi:hypothetical protein
MMNQPPASSLASIASDALNDVRHYLLQIGEGLYTQSLDILSGSTIGQHTRHIIEFYSCLIDQSEEPDLSVINYAARKRDLMIETQTGYATSLIDRIVKKLHELNLQQPCKVQCEEHGADSEEVYSTIGRELVYNIEHTIHHLAIVKIALKTMAPSMELPAHFGIAPSTIRHRHEACAQ